jgi:hypothetical protein
MPDHARHSRRRAGAVGAHLFVAGNTPRSLTARQALESLLEMLDLGERFDLSIVDVLPEPRQALRFGLVATPTLLLERAGRSLRFIGDFSRRDELTEFLHGAFNLHGAFK